MNTPQDRTKRWLRLPKWARHDIRSLEENLAAAEIQLLRAQGKAPTRVCIGSSYRPDGYLGEDRIATAFRVSENPDETTPYIETRLIHDEMRKRWGVEVRGDFSIEVAPSSGNVVHVFRTTR